MSSFLYIVISACFGFIVSYVLGIGRGKKKVEAKAERTVMLTQTELVKAQNETEQKEIEKNLISEAIKIANTERATSYNVKSDLSKQTKDIKSLVSDIIRDSEMKAEQARKRYEN